MKSGVKGDGAIRTLKKKGKEDPPATSHRDENAKLSSSSPSWLLLLRDLALFVNMVFSVPMWTMAFFTGLYGMIVVCCIAYCSTINHCNWYHTIALSVILLYIPFVLTDKDGPAGLRPTYATVSDATRQRLLNLPSYRWLAAYFPIRLHKTVDLDASKQPYLFLYHPHGVIGMGCSAALNTNGCGFDRLFPGLSHPHGVTLDAPFYCPLFREFLIAIGFLHAQRKTLVRTLQQQRRSIVLVPGGAPEALYAAPGTFRLVRKTAFLRLALETGATPVPCLAFGENDAFSVLSFPPESAAFQMQQRLCQLLSFSTPLLKSPFCQRRPIHVVVGGPVHFVDPASAAADAAAPSVQDCQAQYMAAVEKLYNEHKDKYGHANIPLEWI